MSAFCNIDYQVNNQNIKTALDDFVKVGIGGRRRKKKLKFVYGNEEARFRLLLLWLVLLQEP